MATVVDRIRLLITGDNESAITKMAEVESMAAKTADKSAMSFNKATSKIGKGFSSLGSMAGQFGIPIEGTLDKIGHKFDSATTKSGKFSAISGLGAGIAAASLGAVALASIKVADAYDTTQSSLDAAVKASGESIGQWQGSIDAAKSKMANLGFTADDTNKAIAAGVVSTQNVGATLKTMSVAADLARFKNISLADATNLVDKAMIGQLRPLKQMGIDLPIAAGGALKLKQAHQSLSAATDRVNSLLQQNHGKITAGSKAYPAYQSALLAVRNAHQKVSDAAHAHDVILAALSKRMGGQATAYSKTFAGQMANLKANMHNVGIEIGQKLMPVVSKLMGFFGKIISNKAALTGVFTVLGGILLGMIGVWVYNTIAAMSFWAAATGGIIILVAALAIGIAWIVTHWSQVWGWVKDIVTGVWHHIVDAFHSVINWLGQNWPLILTILTGPFGAVVWFIKDNWNGILDFFRGVVGTIGSVFSTVVDFITAPFKAAFNAVVSMWDNTLGGLHFGGIMGFGAFSIPTIQPLRDNGGPVQAMKPYLIGRGSSAEVFVPSGAGTIVPHSRIGGAMGGNTIIVNAQTNASSADIANDIGWALRTQAA